MSARRAIYLDANAGAPLRPRVIEALLPLLHQQENANPSSVHAPGRAARAALEGAREQVVASFGPGTFPEQVLFTSSGTEASQTALRGILERERGIHWITTPVEHDATLQIAKWHQSRGDSVDFLPVDSSGRPRADRLAELWKPQTKLLSFIWVNNETGAVSDLLSLARFAKERGALVHVDAAQAWGKLPMRLNELPIDYASFSGHKIGALSGSGVLWARDPSRLASLIRGKQEQGRRGGTVGLANAVSLGAAAMALEPEAWSARVASLRDRLQTEILERIPGVLVNGGKGERVANTLSLSFEGMGGQSLVPSLDLAGYAVSSGSACASQIPEPSHVLLALGRTPDQAKASLRVSLVDALPWEDLQGFVDALETVVRRLRKAA